MFQNKFILTLLNIPRFTKKLIVIFTDIFLCIISIWLAFCIRLDEFVDIREINILVFIISVSIAIPIFWLRGIYKILFRYSDKTGIIFMLVSNLIYSCFFVIIIIFYTIPAIPRSIGILQPIILFILMISSRLIIQYLLKTDKNFYDIPKVLIYGAGNAGRQLAASLEVSKKMKVLGFIDDDKNLHNQFLLGKKIYSSNNIGQVIKINSITHIILAIPSINRSKRKSILDKIKLQKVVVNTLPSISDLVEGKISISDIKELNIDDLLERDEIQPDLNLLSKNIKSKNVLVTGSGGSIGSELCRQIVKLDCQKLILVENNEYSLYRIFQELKKINENLYNSKIEIVPLLASVQDRNRMKKIIKTFHPDSIFHAAAYKHVSLVEENICEGVKNNVFGTLNLIELAIENNLSNFVLISTDKAVRPTNIMGASKRVAELCLQALSKFYNKNKTKFCIVRFGNVLNSSGSIIPQVKRQILEGGPVTLTHPDVTRFFMTISEASQLVIQASSMTIKSDIFILEMGKAVKINEMIKKIISLSGLTVKDIANPDGDIEIKIIGLRPGEKLHEELLLGDNLQVTEHPKILRANDPSLNWSEMRKILASLETMIENNEILKIIDLFNQIVNGFKKKSKIADPTFNKSN